MGPFPHEYLWWWQLRDHQHEPNQGREAHFHSSWLQQWNTCGDVSTAKQLLVQKNFLCDSIVIIGTVSMPTKRKMESTISEHYTDFPQALVSHYHVFWVCMAATFLSEQKMVFKKLHGKLMKKANAALHRSKSKEGPKNPMTDVFYSVLLFASWKVVNMTEIK